MPFISYLCNIDPDPLLKLLEVLPQYNEEIRTTALT